jgi:hypothetical protein
LAATLAVRKNAMDSQEWRSAIKAAATEDIDTGVRQFKLLYIIAQLILNISQVDLPLMQGSIRR